MRNFFQLMLTVLLAISIIAFASIQNIQAEEIPTWVRNNAKWWSEDLITEKDFVLALEFLINEGIIKVQPTSVEEEKANLVPTWIKNNAAWWVDNQISDEDFLNGIQHLIKVGIISVQIPDLILETETEKMCGCIEGCKCTLGGIDLSRAGPREGSGDAPITIVMFSDHQCKNCARWLEHVKPELSEKYFETGKVKFYLMDFPFLGTDSSSSAQAAYCAADQGKFHEFHEVLFEKQSGVQSGWASEESLIGYSSELGLDVKEFEQCMISEKHALRVSHNKWVGSLHAIESTPVFFVIDGNDSLQRINGPQPLMVFDDVIGKMS